MGLRDRIVADRGRGEDSSDGVTYYRRRLLEEIDLGEIAVLSEEQRRARLERVVGRMVSREGPVLTTAERARLIRRVVDEAVGLGVLEPLLADDSVTEIMVNGTDEIYVERDGRIERADFSFSDEGQLYQTIDRIVSQINRRVDESSPMVDARLPTGERVNVIIPPRGAGLNGTPPAPPPPGPDDAHPPLPAAVHDRRARLDPLDGRADGAAA